MFYTTAKSIVIWEPSMHFVCLYVMDVMNIISISVFFFLPGFYHAANIYSVLLFFIMSFPVYESC